MICHVEKFWQIIVVDWTLERAEARGGIISSLFLFVVLVDEISRQLHSQVNSNSDPTSVLSSKLALTKVYNGCWEQFMGGAASL